MRIPRRARKELVAALLKRWGLCSCRKGSGEGGRRGEGGAQDGWMEGKIVRLTNDLSLEESSG